ncbi:phospholipase A2 inhibitor and Ly6/PLAUR domain-containing protein-like [Rhineura floridana]|uniref:phospholipase A2 inhibitor and Ly6/PLAUR domain-containing protein-like n=1 Tax=Rhineura floridana TaxID=261503 RepID=UPI002AC88D29|nr:phospholipase A2 inhibitor and Ly6/PLAUR domain-containing protein-like [Rhineura floridana]
MQDLLKVFPLFVILTIGTSLKCEVCYNLGLACHGPVKTCPPKKDTCVVAFAESTIEGKTILTVEKSCDSSKICSTPPMYFYLGLGKTLRTSLTCCRGDACGKVKPKLPPIETKANGKQCPTCYAWSDTCNAKMMNCTGLETYCFDVAATTYSNGQRQRNIMKGCTTKSVCVSITRGQSHFLGSVDVVEKAKCTPDVSRGSRSSELLLLTFSGLLLLKFLS